MNTQGKAVNTQGKAVNTQGKAVNTQGKTVDTQRKAVNTQGKAVNTQGKAVIELMHARALWWLRSAHCMVSHAADDARDEYSGVLSGDAL